MTIEFKEDNILEWLLNNQDREAIMDCAEHGCSGGVIGELIYYADSEAFYEKYKDEIWRRLWDAHEEYGSESVLHFISTFNGAKDVGSDVQFSNLLAWWACEEVCRGICSDWEQDDNERQQELDDEIRSGWADAETPFADNH